MMQVPSISSEAVVPESVQTVGVVLTRLTERPELAAIELRNIFEVAGLIARSALWREESRGAHYRTDFPEKRESFAVDSGLSRDE